MYIPEYIKYIMQTLEQSGYSAYICGGAVRDYFIGKIPKDYDVITSATPQQVKEIFFRTIDTGIKHGTVTVIIDGNTVEVTTLRKDGTYKDNRHPEEVMFTDSLKEDVSRRDFTVNAMAVDLYGKMYDYYGGLHDLKDKIIKCVGNSDKRYKEDALRMMRAIRFSSVLGFTIEKETLNSITKNAYLIKNISNERIKDELCKILVSDNPDFGIKLLAETNLLQYIIPELYNCVDFDQKNYHHRKDVFEHTLIVIKNTPKRLIVRLSALLHDIGKPRTFSIKDGVGHFYHHHIEGALLAENILQRLKFDNKTTSKVITLVKEHMSRYRNLRSSSIKRFISRVGIDNLDDLFDLQIADIKGSAPPFDFSEVLSLKEEVNKILNERQPLTVRDLDINGYDLIAIGYKSGKQMGDILKYLLEKVLENPELNKKEKLIKMVECK
jgi:tRNA nucleotidyltransferase (CCA-adding enzyme)